LTQTLHLQPNILTTLWLGLVAIRTNTPYPDVQEDVLPHLKIPITLQARLGWDNLYKGRVSSAWATAIDKEHPKLKQSGEQVMIMIQKHIWQFILDMWKIRNQHLHHNAPQLDLPNYRQAAITLYERKSQLPPAAQDALYRQPLETILELPAPQLEQWVVRGYRYFTQQVKAAKQQAKIQTTDIRNFFRPQPPHNADLQPP